MKWNILALVSLSCILFNPLNLFIVLRFFLPFFVGRINLANYSEFKYGCIHLRKTVNFDIALLP